jgi:hypothetical protein
MKKLFKLLPFLLAAATLLVSCNDDDDIDQDLSSETKGAYILNYGGYEAGTSSITKYDYDTDELTEFYFQNQNGFSKINSAPQYAYHYEGHIYFMNNSPDNILVTDELFVAQDTITADIVKPRNCVGYGDYLYVACWGGDVWTDISISYIAKINLKTNTVEKKIALPGGSESVQIANGKLYAALGYKHAVAVMDLSTEEISYITTTENCSYLLKDKNDNLYVSLVSYESGDGTGLAYINTTTDEITFYPLKNVSSAYASVFALSKDESEIYVIASVGYPAVGGVKVFDTESKEFEEEPFVDGITGINGVSVNPVDGKIYLFISNGATTDGEMKIYSAEGVEETVKPLGAAPAWALFLD